MTGIGNHLKTAFATRRSSQIDLVRHKVLIKQREELRDRVRFRRCGITLNLGRPSERAPSSQLHPQSLSEWALRPKGEFPPRHGLRARPGIPSTWSPGDQARAPKSQAEAEPPQGNRRHRSACLADLDRAFRHPPLTRGEAYRRSQKSTIRDQSVPGLGYGQRPSHRRTLGVLLHGVDMQSWLRCR